MGSRGIFVRQIFIYLIQYTKYLPQDEQNGWEEKELRQVNIRKIRKHRNIIGFFRYECYPSCYPRDSFIANRASPIQAFTYWVDSCVGIKENSWASLVFLDVTLITEIFVSTIYRYSERRFNNLGSNPWFCNAPKRQGNLGVGTTSPLPGHNVWVEGTYRLNSMMVYTS